MATPEESTLPSSPLELPHKLVMRHQRGYQVRVQGSRCHSLLRGEALNEAQL